MPSLGTLAFCFQFLMVAASSQPSLDLDLDSAVHASLTGENGIEEDNFQAKLQRQKRQAPLRQSRSAYIVHIDLSFTSPSAPTQDYFKNLSLPISINTSDSMITISNINVTTDAPPMNKSITIKMSVKLNINFQNALKNTSSDLYMEYKRDFEYAFKNAYQRLPGFISATVTGFRNGSVSVDYDVKAVSATLDQLENANRDVVNSINASYMINPDSFVVSAVVTDQTNLYVFPDDIFKGDTVIMACGTKIVPGIVTWDHSGQVVSQSDRHSIQTTTTPEMSISALKITSIAQSDSGPYTCVFKDNAVPSNVLYKAAHNLTVAAINIVPSHNIDVVCKRVNVLLTCCIDRSLQSFNVRWYVSGLHISGTQSIRDNCTEYLLEIKDFQCPRKKSGAVATYTCELSTGNGASRNESIKVTYLQIAHITITQSPSVSEGYSFSLMCTSNVTNYDKVIWQIQTGTTNITIEGDPYIHTYTTTEQAKSNLTVKTATLEWNGTYTCTFFQKDLPSSASTAVEVVPLPLKQNIFVDPIEAFIKCNTQQELKCCTDKMGHYNVTFTVQNRTFFPEKRPQTNQMCYVYNYKENICNKNLSVYCTFQNRIHGSVQSPYMELRFISNKTKVSCSDSIGIGEEGATIIKRCPVLKNTMRGNITYECRGGNWAVARNNCISEAINTLLTAAEALVSSPQRKEKLPEYLENLAKGVMKEQQEINTSPPDLGAVVTMLDLVSSISVEANLSTVENFLTTVNIIVNTSTINSWNELNRQETNKSSLLLESVERFSQYLQPVNNSIPRIRNTNLQLEGIVILGDHKSQYEKNFTFSGPSDLSGNVLIKEAQIQNIQPNTTIISVAYSTLGQILPRDNKTNESVNGLVMTTTVGRNKSQDRNTSQGIEIILTFSKSNVSLIDPKCVFWNFTSRQWDNTGCTPENHEQTVTCNCSHLTSFSILMSPNVPVSIGGKALDYITYIGLSISILSLLACISIEFLVWKFVTKNRTSYMRHICMLNIATSLLIADIWFIVAASLHDNVEKMKDVCVAVTFFIHLFYLCVFFWMLVLGLMLFYRLVFILHDTSKTTQKVVAFSLGYGCPIIISVITIAVTHPYGSYRRKDACWLNWETSKALFAFVIPALIIVAVNLIIAIVVIGKILRPAVGDKPSKQERSSFIQVGKSIGVLTPLLGLTWGFGLATVFEDSSVVFHVLFTVLNALQGLFILLFGTVWDKKVREALVNKYPSTKWSSQQTKSVSLGTSAPVFSMKCPLSKRLNNLRGKTGKYEISSTETTSFSTENTSLANSFFH